MNTQPLACVMGDMDLVRPLGLAGIRCAVVCAPGAAPRYSRFTRGTVTWSDAWDHPGIQVAALERFAATQAEPPVLFYQEDRELLLVSRYRDRLVRCFRFVVPAAHVVEDLVDKGRFQLLARRLRLPVPRAEILQSWSAATGQLDLRFPLIVKPLTRRTDQWTPVRGAAKAIPVPSPAALAALWPRLAVSGLPLLLQEAVPGPETQVESYHVYVDRAGEIVAEFTGRKLRTWPVQYGHSTALMVVDPPPADVVALGREIVKRIELRGVAKLDFKRGPDDRLYLLEVNPRFTLWHHPAAAAGVNIPALVYADLTGSHRARPACVQPSRAARWSKPWHDALAARDLSVPWLSWLRWTVAAETKRAWAWDDPLPFLGAAVWRLARWLRTRLEHFSLSLALKPSGGGGGRGGHG